MIQGEAEAGLEVVIIYLEVTEIIEGEAVIIFLEITQMIEGEALGAVELKHKLTAGVRTPGIPTREHLVVVVGMLGLLLRALVSQKLDGALGIRDLFERVMSTLVDGIQDLFRTVISTLVSQKVDGILDLFERVPMNLKVERMDGILELCGVVVNQVVR